MAGLYHILQSLSRQKNAQYQVLFKIKKAAFADSLFYFKLRLKLKFRRQHSVLP